MGLHSLAMDVTRDLKSKKEELLGYFRYRSSEILSELAVQYAARDFKKKALAFNKAIVRSRETLVSSLTEVARSENWTNSEILESVLMITYANDLVMLEARNSIWEYDYMAFSRRIGELWESFCKLCFSYPSTKISKFIPPLFLEVKNSLSMEVTAYIDGLNLHVDEKEKLKKYYDSAWGLVTSGEIQLECDLHFTDGITKYVVDFKSGFGSNEKGNTNRLLLVGSMYNYIETESYQCALFVRSVENNHYLTVLRNSGVWNVSCGVETYDRIHQFTGFDLHRWIEDNVDWMDDFLSEMREVVVRKNLQSYLVW